MMYKGPGDRATRSLRRLWSIDVYDGDREIPGQTTHVETVIAWNAPGAIRQLGNKRFAATYPVQICYITWQKPPQKILNPKDGPTGEVMVPSVRRTDPTHPGKKRRKKRKRRPAPKDNP